MVGANRSIGRCDGTIEAVTHAALRERPPPTPPPRGGRVRCLHCDMPVRRGPERCWSCGMDPALRPEAEDDGRGEERGAAPDPRASRPLWLVIGGLLIVLVVLGSATLVAPADDGHGVRGLAARLRGGAWLRTEVRGASAEFPAPPVRRDPGGRDELLVATTSDVHAELLVADVTGAERLIEAMAVAERLVAGYADRAGGRVVQRAPVAAGAAGLDAVVDAGDREIRLRAIVAGTTAYLLAVAGSPSASERFLRSFQLDGEAAPPGR